MEIGQGIFCPLRKTSLHVLRIRELSFDRMELSGALWDEEPEKRSRTPTLMLI